MIFHHLSHCCSHASRKTPLSIIFRTLQIEWFSLSPWSHTKWGDCIPCRITDSIFVFINGDFWNPSAHILQPLVKSYWEIIGRIIYLAIAISQQCRKCIICRSNNKTVFRIKKINSVVAATVSHNFRNSEMWCLERSCSSGHILSSQSLQCSIRGNRSRKNRDWA